MHRLRLAVVIFLLFVTASAATTPLAPPTAPWLLAEVQALTAPAMEGRRSGTPGGDLAARHLADVLAAAGLRGGGEGGSFLQSFAVDHAMRLVADPDANVLAIEGKPARFTVEREWIPHGGAIGGEVAGGVTFAGYALAAPEQGYDDWAGHDVRGRIVLALTGAPPHLVSVATSRIDKLVAARGHGAAALLLVDDALPSLGVTATRFDLPSATVTGATADALLAASGHTVAELAAAIDARRAAASVAVPAAVRLRIHLERAERRSANVVGILPGTDPVLAQEAVVLGAHYDHLGRVQGTVHPGADDNASGTALVLGLARAFAAAGGAPRTLVVTLFAGEELGLLGSRHYVANPVVPLARTVAMLNFDMVGRLRDDRLSVGGVDSGSGLRAMVVEATAREKLDLAVRATPWAPSDHVRFYQAGTPVLFFFTGTHEDYHRPGDTADRINAPGLARIAAAAAHLIERLAGGPRPVYAALPAPERTGRGGGGDGRGPFFGIMVDGRGEGDGVRVAGVMAGSTAARLGVAEGDVIVKFAGIPVVSFGEFLGMVRARRPGERVSVVYLRDGRPRSGSETLDTRP